MPGRKKKKFIDKKHAVTFSLVHRSQKDPLQADEDAPQRVLLQTEVNDKDAAKIRKEEQQKYGVLFEDDYDYMQHLRDVEELYEVAPGEETRLADKRSNDASVQLPSSVFGSAVETDVGLLNKAAPDSGPRLDWDPDIVAALDEDFDFEDPDNQLDDDFMSMAMAEGGEGSQDEENAELKARGGQATLDFVRQQRVHFGGEGIDKFESEGSDKEVGDDDVPSDEADFSDVGSDFGSYDGQNSFTEEETKSRFTSYSMTSSVIRRNTGLSLVDDRFEKLYEQYDEEEIGALDHEEITGCVPADSEILSSMLDEFEKTHTLPKLKDVVQPAEGDQEEQEESESEEEMIKVELDEKPKERWDCESILSTYSTLYNHPKTIHEPKKIKPIKLTKRAQIPAGILPERGLTIKQVESLTDEGGEVERVPTYRPKDETADEKKARKVAIKGERKARREQKKETKTAFKEEKKRQTKEMINIKNNIQGMQIS